MLGTELDPKLGLLEGESDCLTLTLGIELGSSLGPAEGA